MALDCSSSVERAMIKTGGLFIILVGLIIFLDSMDLYRNAPLSLITASIVTVAFGLIVYRNAKKHGLFDGE